MKIPKLFQNSAIYSLVMVLQKGISFLLLPLYTQYLTPADYGIMGVSGSITSFLSICITLGLGAAAARFYYSHKKDENYAKKLYGTIVTIVLINSAVFGTIFLVFHKWIIDPFLGNIDYYPYIFIGILCTIVMPLYQYFQEYLQARQEGLHYGINSMCYFAINVVLIILSLVIFDMGLLGFLLANLITSVLFFIYAVVIFLRRLRVGVDKQIAKEAIIYSAPLLPHQLAAWSNGTLDRLLVNGLKSESDAGLYNLGQQYSSLSNIMGNAINQAYVPWFFDKINYGKEGLTLIYRVAEGIICVFGLFTLIMSLFSKELLTLMISNPAYKDVWMTVPLLIGAYLFHSLYFIYVNVLYLKDSKVVFTISLVSLVVNIGTNVLLIPPYGVMGSAIAFWLTYFVQCVVAHIWSHFRNKVIRFNSVKLYFVCFVSLSMSLTALLMQNLAWMQVIGFKLIIVLLFAGLILLMNRKHIRPIMQICRQR